jgi:hypothetical protein
MPPALLERYQKDPLGMDDEVRRQLGLPEDRYYTVSIWPVSGMVRVDTTRTRVVRSKKVSKSDQS